MKKLVLLFALIASFATALAQKNTTNGDLNTWFFWLNSTKITEHWGLSSEVHLRQSSPLSDRANFLFRPMVDYSLNKDVIFSAGYTYIRNYPNDPFPAELATTEHNIWQQLVLKHRSGKVNFLHRFRQEQRFAERITTDENGDAVIDDERTYINRFRYRIQFQFPVFNIGKKQVTATIFDELWFVQFDNLRPNVFNRNWIYVGLDYPISEQANFHLGFMDQFDRKSETQYVQQPILQFMVSTKLGDFTRSKSDKMVPNP